MVSRYCKSDHDLAAEAVKALGLAREKERGC